MYTGLATEITADFILSIYMIFLLRYKHASDFSQ